MFKCLKCQNEIASPVKTWKYQQFQVEAYSCNKCKSKFREYLRDGKRSFILKLVDKKGYRKA